MTNFNGQGFTRLFKLHVLVAVTLSGCGYKAPPSPLFDENERFGEQIDVRRKQGAEREKDSARSSPTPNVFWPTPSPTPSSTPQSRQVP